MNRVLVGVLAVVVLLLAAPAVLANRPPPPNVNPPQTQTSNAVAAIAGSAGAVLAGFWIVRRPKP